MNKRLATTRLLPLECTGFMAAAQATPREASVSPLKKELVWEVSKHRPAESVDREDASVAIGGNERLHLAEDGRRDRSRTLGSQNAQEEAQTGERRQGYRRAVGVRGPL